MGHNFQFHIPKQPYLTHPSPRPVGYPRKMRMDNGPELVSLALA
ncbi:hypothetical protein SB912_18750 [Pantoea sp. SIMBA_072]|nr:hypothetical protein [Pantoea agglomerans]KDA94319.1 hypothetical protein T296_11775 [Pantoea agglomerans Eh318]